MTTWFLSLASLHVRICPCWVAISTTPASWTLTSPTTPLSGSSGCCLAPPAASSMRLNWRGELSLFDDELTSGSAGNGADGDVASSAKATAYESDLDAADAGRAMAMPESSEAATLSDSAPPCDADVDDDADEEEGVVVGTLDKSPSLDLVRCEEKRGGGGGGCGCGAWLHASTAIDGSDRLFNQISFFLIFFFLSFIYSIFFQNLFNAFHDFVSEFPFLSVHIF